MKENELLPIGTVVLLKDAEKKIMIFGFAQEYTDEEGNIVDYDYVGVPYPEGNLDASLQLMFNADQIEEVYSMGFIHADYQDMIENINENIEKIHEMKKNSSESSGLLE